MNLFYRNNIMYVVWVIFAICISLIYALEQSIYIPLFQLDGAFQTASGLYRLSEGYIPGKDFFPYLGLLITWVLYPIFLIAGSNIGASMFAAHFMDFFGLSFSLCYFSRGSNVITSIIFSLLCSFFIVCTFDTLNIVLFERVTPGNSLRPLRSIVSPVALIFIFVIINKIPETRRQIVAVSFVCGMSLLWSNDFGYPTALMSGLLYIFCLKRQSALNIKNFLYFGLMCVMWFLFLSMVMTFGNIIPMIKYNIDIASDQGWYFGPWFTENHIYSLTDIVIKFIIPALGWKILLLPFCLFLYVKTKNIKHLFQFSIGMSLFLGAAISVSGGHIDYEYANAYIFWCYCLCVIYILNICMHFLNSRKRFKSFEPYYKYTPLYMMFIGSFVLSFITGVATQKIHDAKTKYGYYFSRELGGYLPVEWNGYLNQDTKSKKVSEDYWGLYSAYNKVFSSAPTDSIIHALGSKRPLFNESLKKSDVIMTVAPDTAGIWLNWLLSSNWDFYGYIIKNYRLEAKYITTDKWVKNDPVKWEKQQCSVINNSIVLNNARRGYYEVSMSYDMSQSKGIGFYMIKNNLNIAMGAGGYIAFDKNKTVFNFPVYVDVNTNDARIFPLKATGNIYGINVKSCIANRIKDESNEWFPNVYPQKPLQLQNVTDKNWLNGVGREKPGFFIPTSPDIKIKDGDNVTFSNGETRKIERLYQNGEYINIVLYGDPIDGSIVGYPNVIYIN